MIYNILFLSAREISFLPKRKTSFLLFIKNHANHVHIYLSTYYKTDSKINCLKIGHYLSKK